MTEEIKDTSTGDQDKSTQNSENKDVKADPVEDKGAANYKNDLLRFKMEMKQQAAENEKLRKQLADNEEKSLMEKSNYKDLFEREKAKRLEIEEMTNQNTQAFYGTLKQEAIKKFAVKHGIAEESIEDLELLNSDMVEIETTSTGKLNVIGAEEFIEDLKVKKPRWFNEGKININNANPSYSKQKDLTAAQLLDLQRKEPLKYKEIMEKRLSFS